MPVVAVGGAGGTVSLTCKFKGVEGNEIDVRIAYGGRALKLRSKRVCHGMQPIRVQCDNKLTGGTGTVDISQAIENLGDEIYEYVAMGYTDSTNLSLIETEYGFGDEGRWGWLRQLYGHVFAARRGLGTDQFGYSDLIAYGPTNNSGVLSILGIELKHSTTPSWYYGLLLYTQRSLHAHC